MLIEFFWLPKTSEFYKVIASFKQITAYGIWFSSTSTRWGLFKNFVQKKESFKQALNFTSIGKWDCTTFTQIYNYVWSLLRFFHDILQLMEFYLLFE